MNIRLGIVGPEDSLILLRKVLHEFDREITVVEKIYKDFEDLRDIASMAQDVDIILYSGQAPYFWVKSNVDIAVPGVYIPRNGTSLYKVLFDIYRDGKDVSALSFDTISPRDIEETYMELNLPLPEVFTMDYDKYLPYEKLIDYHKNLWAKGKTRAAVTCLNKTYEELKKLGIPVYRIYPTVSSVRHGLERAMMYGESIKLKETQMALILVRVEDLDDILYESSSYQLQIQLLELYQVILGYGDETSATVTKTGDTEFMIITTRGCLEESTDIFMGSPLLHALKANTHLKVTVGIGFGRTAKMAETNARQAVRLSKENGSDCCFLVTEEGKIVGPIRENRLNTEPLSDLNLEELAKKLNMNVVNLNKLKASMRRLGKNEVTPKELSTCMSISQRSARRILAQLEEKGAARIVGIRRMSGKGRPSQVYQVLI